MKTIVFLMGVIAITFCNSCSSQSYEDQKPIVSAISSTQFERLRSIDWNEQLFMLVSESLGEISQSDFDENEIQRYATQMIQPKIDIQLEKADLKKIEVSSMKEIDSLKNSGLLYYYFTLRGLSSSYFRYISDYGLSWDHCDLANSIGQDYYRANSYDFKSDSIDMQLTTVEVGFDYVDVDCVLPESIFSLNRAIWFGIEYYNDNNSLPYFELYGIFYNYSPDDQTY